MKKSIIIGLLTAVVVFTGAGCSKKEAQSNTAKYDSVAMDKAGGAANGATANVVSTKSESKAPQAEIQKKVIQTGDIRIVVDDLGKTSSSLRSKTDELGGYIESESLTEYNGTSRIRIPSQKLDDFIGYIEKSFEVESKNTSIQDITTAYVDNEARLKNLKSQEAQTQEIMKKANSVEEILKVQNELFRVRGEIEALEARKKTWDRDVDFSTITVIARKKQLAIESKLRVLTGSEFFKSMSKGFSDSTTKIILFIQNLIIFAISNIIMIIILGIAGFFGYKKFIKGKIKL